MMSSDDLSMSRNENSSKIFESAFNNLREKKKRIKNCFLRQKHSVVSEKRSTNFVSVEKTGALEDKKT